MTSGTKSNSSVVAMLEVRHNGKQVIVPVAVGGFGFQNGIQIDSNAITSAYGKNNSISKVLHDAIEQERNGNFRLYYLDEEKATALFQVARVPMPKMPGTHDGGFIHSLTDTASPVKLKISSVTQSQQFKRWFGDWQNDPAHASKVVNADGTPKVVYHQTDADFTIFDPRHEGAGTRDSDTPFGIFLKSSDKNIGLKGSKQMPLYADIKNPLTVRNREQLIYELQKISDGYATELAEHRALDVQYEQKRDNAIRELREYIIQWRKENPDASRTALYDDSRFNQLFNAEDDLTDEWESKAREIELRSKEAITKDLEAAGYDGVIIQQDVGSFGRSTDAYIALHPEQVKSATDNIGTFDGKNPDIRYSRELDSEYMELAKDPEGKQHGADGGADGLRRDGPGGGAEPAEGDQGGPGRGAGDGGAEPAAEGRADAGAGADRAEPADHLPAADQERQREIPADAAAARQGSDPARAGQSGGGGKKFLRTLQRLGDAAGGPVAADAGHVL